MRRIVRPVAHILIGLVLGAILVIVLFMPAKPDLSVWHQLRLDGEFCAADAGDGLSLAGYREL